MRKFFFSGAMRVVGELIAGSSIFFILLYGCSRKKTGDSSILLTINGEAVHMEDVEDIISSIYPWRNASESYKLSFLWDPSKKKLRREILDAVIERKLLLQEARKRGIVVTGKDLTEELKRIKAGVSKEVFGKLFWRYGKDPARWMRHLREEILIRKLLREYVYRGITVSVDEIDRYYADHVSDFTGKEWVKVHMIMFDSLAEARNFRKRVKRAEDFIGVEHEKNVYIPEDGFLFFKGDIPDNLWKIFNTLPLNHPSKVYNLHNGYYVFLVTSRGKGYPGGQKAIRRKIRKILLEKKRHQAYMKFLANLKKKAKIKINLEY